MVSITQGITGMSNGAETRIKRSQIKILTAAEDVFLRNGFVGTNMDAVAEQAGVSKQTVYARFKSKEALFIQVVEQMTGGAAHDIGEDVEDDFEGTSVEDFLTNAAIDQLSIVMTPRLMRLRRMVIGEVERFPELGKSLYENGPQRSIRRIAKAIAHYSRLGELRETDPYTAATHFNWLVMGGPTNAAMLLGDTAIPSERALTKHARESVEIFLAAFREAARALS
ncbi:TetR/AcrR family transcriptional regulator [uncultured Roseobacter sp.]|uniref:TetR/AcrR family transcriptional regulator n=1 Tax=uncultured Roseobacter sp. TaxID=114847 RepID=UPI0026373CB3|nr:TetR/AcrR family transcriptional regulator [uncultured Roseobacter sp.]